jgi:hypothetical protein
MGKAIAVLAIVGVAGIRAVSADSASAQLTVGVTVARSCAVDARPMASMPSAMPRLTCVAGARTTLRMSESVHRASQTAMDGLRVVTLNF